MEILDNEIDIYRSPEEHDWEVFIGNNAHYYIPIWEKFKKQDSKIHFHLSAFFLAIYWLGYRKMYKYAIAYLVFAQTIPIIGLLLVPNSYMQVQLITVLTYPLFGLFGNWLYYDHAQKKITAIKQTHTTEASQQKAIQEAGQTNIAFPFILLFVSMFLGIFVPSLLHFFY